MHLIAKVTEKNKIYFGSLEKIKARIQHQGEQIGSCRSIKLGPLHIHRIRSQSFSFTPFQQICEFISMSSHSNANLALAKAFLFLYSEAYTLSQLGLMREMIDEKEREKLKHFQAFFNQIFKL